MNPVAPPTRRRGQGERGATLMVVAIALPVLILMTAFAIDLGRQRSSRRTMQARADVIALDLLHQIQGRTEDQILGDPTTETAVAASAARNEVDRDKITFEFGRWVDTGISGRFEGVLGNVVPTAVKVRAQEDVDYFFQPGSGHTDRSAVAVRDGEAEFTIGSYAANAESAESELLAAILGDAFGANVDLVGYSGLVDNDVQLALLAQELVAQGVIGSPDELLTTSVDARDLFKASAEALRNNPDADPDDLAAATLFDQYAAQIPGGIMIPLGEAFHVEQGGEEAALSSSMNALDILAASAFLANGDNLLAVPELAANLPLLGDITQVCSSLDPPTPSPCSALRVIEGPVHHRGRVGTGTSTRQVALRIGGGLPNIAGLAGVTMQLSLDSAVGRATIRDIRCGSPIAFDLFVGTSLFESAIELKGRLANLIGVTVKVSRIFNEQDAEDNPGDLVTFFIPDDVGGPGFEAGEGDIGLSGLQIQIIPDGVIGIVLKPAFDLAVNNLLAALLSPTGLLNIVDNDILTPLANAFGLNVAGADVDPIDADCTNARLVG